ncbi:MAG: hypothetical protein VX916_07320 [Planctomycetota bacterium]|nr:hypothetical protein [Planctomycetota bacterium]
MMSCYRHVQVGQLIIGSFLAVEVMFLFMSSLGTTIFTSLFIVPLVLIVLFGWLTVEVDDEKVSCIFGLGWPRKRIPLDDIASVEIVRNKWWYGFGIRLTPSGWMFNIQGLDAVMVERKSGKKFRIGTDEPADLAEAIESAIGGLKT